ncbi:MAG TPA: PAS domain-containing protein [Myxococcota bacterium]|nr:PAS domain-containing protein [Myxococcota bacterium]
MLEAASAGGSRPPAGPIGGVSRRIPRRPLFVALAVAAGVFVLGSLCAAWDASRTLGAESRLARAQAIRTQLGVLRDQLHAIDRLEEANRELDGRPLTVDRATAIRRVREALGALADGTADQPAQSLRVATLSRFVDQRLALLEPQRAPEALAPSAPSEARERTAHGLSDLVLATADEIELADSQLVEAYGDEVAAWTRRARVQPYVQVAVGGAFLALVWLLIERTLRGHEAAEAERARAAAQYRLLFEGNPLPMWVYDVETLRFVTVNEAAVARYGYSRDEFRSMSIADIRPPEDVARLRQKVESSRAIRSSGVWRHRRKDGTLLDVEIDSDPIEIDGRACRLVVTRDVTDRVRAETERDRVFDLSVDLLAVCDLEGRMVRVNPACSRVLGYPPEAIVGRSFFDFLHPEDRTRSAAVFARLKSTGVHTGLENRYLRADGGVVWLRWNAVIDHERSMVYASGHDVSETREAAKQVAERAERYRLAAKATNTAIWDWDFATDEVDWSGETESILGFSQDEIDRRIAWWKEHIHPEDRARVVVSIEDAIRRGERFWSDEYRFVRGDGAVLWIFDQGYAVKDESGQTVRMIGAMADVTRRKQSAEKEEQLEEQLRQAQRLETLGRLAGGIAHDFNNLLTAILGNAQFLLEDLQKDDPRRGDLDEIKTAALRAADLTHHLLAFGRRQVLQPRVVNLNDVFANSERLLQRVIGEDVTLAYVGAPDLGNVYVDENQLVQVLMNLVVNARDAMPEGGRITIETSNVELAEEYVVDDVRHLPGSYVLLAVTDTGEGVAPEIRSRIFEPFFTTKERGKGTGLGLSTVYGIVKQSGGYVWCYSEVGIGTTFKVYLPRVDAPVETPRARPHADGSAGGSETILVVEDEDAVRNLACRVLERLGYRVREAPSPEIALRMVQESQEPIDLVVTDVVLPQMSGSQLVREIARVRPRVRLRVLYMSGYADDAIVHHGVLEAGVAFLQKPFTAEALGRRVREALDT